MFKILVAEDDINTSKLMNLVLEKAGYDVVCAYDGEEAFDKLLKNHIDLIILDVMMPKMDGYDFTEKIRSIGNMTPILMVTAKQMPEERCKGFISGADDYMVKPVNEEEMLLRIKALLRRSQIANEHKLRVGKVVLDYDCLTVSKEGETVTLPQKEFYLLFKLLSFPNKIFTRLQLMDEIWGVDSNTVDTTVNVHVNRLRNKFNDWTEFSIVSIRGIGYKAVINNEN